MTSPSRHAQLRLEVLRKEERIPDTLAGIAGLLGKWGFSKEPQECMWVIAYDSNLNIRTVVEVARGSHASVELHLPTMLSAVLTCGCDRFMLAHNHPSGRLAPSRNDIDLTVAVMEAANACGLYFEDHMIVAPSGRWLSMTQKGIIDPVDYESHVLNMAAGIDRR